MRRSAGRAEALCISSMNWDEILAHEYSVPYHFSLWSHPPGYSRETMVKRKLSGRRHWMPWRINSASNLRKRLEPLKSHSRGKGFCITELILLVNRLAGVFCLNLKSTSAIPFCSSKIHSWGGVSRSKATYWKKIFIISW